MSHPSFAEYTDALQLGLGAVLSDPLLARGRLLMRAPGLPVALSGNFALTFVVEVNDRKYAVRCFHKPMDGLQERYEAIGRCLRSIANPYLVDFVFQPSGIRTESGTQPVVRMDWAEGRTLGAFVAEHRNDGMAMRDLRDTLRRLAANLGVCGIAHGDIQPSNIIVETPTRLKLIDYDGMFVPALRPLASAEIGQRNFQHPGRRECHFDEHLDAFSFAVLDLAIDALSKRPSLWTATASGEDAFLLRAEDFVDPARSPAFRALAQVPGLEKRARDFAAICASPFERIPCFGDFLAGRHIPEVAVVFSGDPTLPLRRRYVAPHPVVHAASFARCCAHVGDRVELIGRVVRVARSHTPRFESTYLRVEFDERGNDMACLRIWADAEARLDDVPDATWTGRWVSAVGLVEPVARGHSGSQRQRDVSISITERAQLQTITETEARYRLQGYGSQTTPGPDAAGGVRTDPVVTDAAPRLKVATTRRPHGGTRPATPRTRRASPPQPAASSAADAPTASQGAAPDKTPQVALPGPNVPAAPPRRSAATVPDATGGSLGAERRPRRTAWILGALVVGTAAVALFVTLVPHEAERAPDIAAERANAKAETRAVASTPPSARALPALPADPVASRLESVQALHGARLPIVTAAGSLGVGADNGAGGPKFLVLDGNPVSGLRDDAIALAHRAVYSDRDVVVGFAECAGASPPCGLRKPFWLLLRAAQPPVVRVAPGLWASSTAGSVTAGNGGVRVDLGVWNGERRAATLTTAGDIQTERQRVPIRALGRTDCALVAESLEACATSTNCQSFASSARRIPQSVWTRLTRIYHEKTGLDAGAYRNLCMRSCELGLTPSAEFIRENACSGAQRGQWAVANPAAGLLGQQG